MTNIHGSADALRYLIGKLAAGREALEEDFHDLWLDYGENPASKTCAPGRLSGNRCAIGSFHEGKFRSVAPSGLKMLGIALNHQASKLTSFGQALIATSCHYGDAPISALEIGAKAILRSIQAASRAVVSLRRRATA